jgi:hypothetical protein
MIEKVGHRAYGNQPNRVPVGYPLILSWIESWIWVLVGNFL